MPTAETVSLTVNAVGFAAIIACSGLAVNSAINRLQAKKTRDEIYEDEDGQATLGSMARFSDLPQRSASALLALVGTMVTLSRAVLTTSQAEAGAPFALEQWLQFATWILLLFQSGTVLTEPLSTIRFRLGCHAAAACLFCLAMTLAEMYGRYVCLELEKMQTILGAVQCLLSMIIGTLDLLLPRRPDVMRNRTVVDRQFTTSALGRLTFSWVEPLIQSARQNKVIEMEDLPELDADSRSSTLQASFVASAVTEKKWKLWKILIRCHRSAILLQLTLAVALSFLSLVPQIALWGTLNALESGSHDINVWFWVLGLGLSMALSSTVDAWLTWVSYSGLNIKIMEQLSAVIFDKAIRRKDVKEAVQAKGSEVEPENDGTHQSTINLVAVDTRRIADFAASNYLLYQCPIKLAMSCVILAKLVGWQGLLAGIAVLVILTPLNGQVARRYSASQSRVMKARDTKMAVVAEALRGIRQIKFAALEQQWEDKINACRDIELQAQRRTFIWSTTMLGLFILGPLGLSAASLSTFAWIHGGLSASVAFPSIAVFTSIEIALISFPESLSGLMDAWVSFGRIEAFLNAPENTTCNMITAREIEFVDATVSWPSDNDKATGDRFLLRGLTLKFPPAGLSVISGPTGSGKSLLLASILGECDVLTGTIKGPQRPTFQDRFDDNRGQWMLESAMAFVSQVPWIENATIKDNILFGLPFDPTRYQDVLFACALEKDLDSFPDADLTEIGAQGVNLSGGQKWRISLARALYSRAEILVMDDIFSAVDAHTGRHLFNHAVTGNLAKGRTRILVTHHTALCLPGTDYVVYLNQGTVCYAGPGEELRRDGDAAIPPPIRESIQTPDDDNDDDCSSSSSLRRLSKRQGNNRPKPARKFVQDEGREKGATKWKVYTGYLTQSSSLYVWFSVFVLYVTYSSLMMARAWWINVWSSHSGPRQVPEHAMSVMHYTVHHVTAEPQVEYDLWFYIVVYIGMSLVACIIGALRSFCILSISLRASRNMFRHLLHTVLRAPLRWLDTVPLGRVLNRFTADFNTVDSVMGTVLGNTIFNALEVVGTVVAGALVNPVLALFTGSIVLVSLAYSCRYLAAAREIKRLESTAKSPILVHFDSALSGLSTIRGFGKGTVYIQRMQTAIDRHAQAYWHLWLLNRWLAFRMNMMGAVFTFVTAVLVISSARGMNASLAGFAISFALRYTSIISRATQIYAMLELSLNSVERIQEYSEISTEDDAGIDPPAAWPAQGRLEVSDLVVSYAPDLPPVLQGVTFHAEPNQRIGVVGRTGAGKSSLALALLRFLQVRPGQIFVDGIDIARIKLHQLRSRLTIIPQDPVLFSGTVRSNLDPFGEHDDLDLQSALERVHWSGGKIPIYSPSSDSGSTFSGTQTTTAAEAESNSDDNEGFLAKPPLSALDLPISEEGRNLSQGQRQLLCLARAIVSRPKIVILDEATSAVDKGTDELIQQSIRAEFGRNSTLLVIAHRISTIADFDRILVLDNGQAVEFGSPHELMEIPAGVFRGLVEENGEREELEKIIFRN